MDTSNDEEIQQPTPMQANLSELRAQLLAALERTQEAFADLPDEELTNEIGKAIAAARAKPHLSAGE